MASDPTSDAGSDLPAGTPVPGRRQPEDKFRIRFRKGGSLRLLSHHDLMRTFERMLRRADLPFHRTQGFHPHPRLVFALSLPLGVVGNNEVVELELERPLDPEEVRCALERQTPPGLAILDVQRIPVRCTARVRGLTYGLRIPPDRVPGLIDKMAEVLAAPECWVDRTRPPRRRLDLRPFLRDLRLSEPTPGSWFLEFDLWLTPGGTARPEEVLGVLGLGDLVESGTVLERTRLDLEEPLPPTGQP